MLKKALMVGGVILFASILLFVGCAKKEAEVENESKSSESDKDSKDKSEQKLDEVKAD